MIDVTNKSATQRFNHGIVTTFGKLDAFDIEKIDGHPDKLVTFLMKEYGWSSADAQQKVDQLMTRVSNNSL
jgi:hypothetical protein